MSFWLRKKGMSMKSKGMSMKATEMVNCSVCGKKFFDVPSLAEHEKSKHGIDGVAMVAKELLEDECVEMDYLSNYDSLVTRVSNILHELDSIQKDCKFLSHGHVSETFDPVELSLKCIGDVGLLLASIIEERDKHRKDN